MGLNGSAVDYDLVGLICSFASGIPVTFLRLQHQAMSLQSKNGPQLPKFLNLARERIPRRGPDAPLHASRLSPVGSSSSLTAAVLRILAATSEDSTGTRISRDDISALMEAVELALATPPWIIHGDRVRGVDEVLYGRCGLLWAFLNIRSHVLGTAAAGALQPILQSIPKLVDTIVDSGRKGSNLYIKQYGEKGALPLMWVWSEGRFGVGA